MTGREQTVRTAPGAVYGDALLAGVGVGLLPDVGTVQEWLGPAGLRVRPDPAAKVLYDRYYQLYCELYTASRQVVHSLARPGTEQ